MDGKIITNLQDLTYLSWSRTRYSSGTAGSYLKAYSTLNGEKTYYKLSNYDAERGVIGHEGINEIIADRLLTILGVDHLPYQLIHADILVDDQPITTWVCASKDFKQSGDSKIALDAYFQAERASKDEKLFDFCKRQGWSKYLYEMLVIDFLILNRDRHGANIEVLRNQRSPSIRLAPLFDHGLSLLCRCETPEELARADVMEDKPVQCCIGSSSAWKNLSLIPKEERPALNPLRAGDKEMLLAGLEEALPEAWREKIWEMIWRRWQAYEGIRD
ncbi:MAG: hypothetical protein LBM74_00765 [Oscillospiraceae bacterium]|jgi:hypothetical protein|nr:hypothetical protein [Oscillospiraceae bacterium]